MKPASITAKILCVLLLTALAAGLCAGCGKSAAPGPQNHVALTLWHPYGQLMKTLMEELIEEFNETAGADKGISINITLVANATEINEKLMAAVHGDPGASAFPDLAVIYPDIGIILAKQGLLTDLSGLFSEAEFSRYVRAFLEEGKMGGDIPYILPVAKSTEVLYLNGTIFDRFAEDTGMDRSMLATFEGIQAVCEQYREWSGGKDFFHCRDLFNLAMTGFHQLGEDLIIGDGAGGGKLNLAPGAYERIWDAYYPAAVKGGAAVFDGFGNYLMAAGEIVCTLESSASVTFYPDTVTYADNTKEECELVILPQPVFENGEKVALQRGGGMCVFSSDEQREYAAGVFLKWFTAPEQNQRFTAQTGYMPVTEAAFGDLMAANLEGVADANVKKLLETVVQMQKEYRFYFPSVYDGIEEIQRRYNQSMLREMGNARQVYLGALAAPGPDARTAPDPGATYEAASKGALERFKAENQ